jgi:hypothetical protein
MKIQQGLVSAKEIRQQLLLADATLKVVRIFPKGIHARVKKEGAVIHIYLYDSVESKYVGVVSAQKDQIGKSPAVAGVRIYQAGLLKQYQHQGLVWKVLDAIGEEHRILASPTVSTAGAKMWKTRIHMDHRHVYLIHREKVLAPFKTTHGEFYAVPVTPGNYKMLKDVLYDGSPFTRLVMTTPKDPLLTRWGLTPLALKYMKLL